MSLRLIRFLSFLFVLFSTFSSFAQISHGGYPYFKGEAHELKYEILLMSVEDIPSLKYQSSNTDKSRVKHLKFAHEFLIDKTNLNSGKWTTIANGQRIWNLGIVSPGAYSLSLFFEKFRLPKGGKLFVYNYTTERVLGAYTEKNNKVSGRFAIEALEGDELVIEYVEPLKPQFEAELQIGKIYHDYKNIFKILNTKRVRVKGSSGSCNRNINCSEGLNWQLEKRAVCHISYGSYIATGTLMNNTNKDGKPYILTAYHVINRQAVAEQAIFYFNYESETCEGIAGPKSQTISGANLRATTDRLDFSLLEMTSIPPSIYQPYYAGWDRLGSVPDRTVCIHHPNGDVKKISMDFHAPRTDTYLDRDYEFDANTHWHISSWELGTTEGGSSGSPLFDTQHRVIGDLTGGDANCDTPVDDYYAKISASWDTYPKKENQLKFWLDPKNTGVLYMDGYNPSIQISKRISCVDSNIEISYNFGMEFESYSWDFGEGASPSNSTSKGPHQVQYENTGTKTVSLIYTKGDLVKKEFSSFVVLNESKPNFTYFLKNKSFKFQDASENAETYHWDFGDGNNSNVISPNHVYQRAGKYQVKLTVGNVCGENYLDKTVNTSYNSELIVYPNPSKDGAVRIGLQAVLFDRIDWKLYDYRGAERLTGFVKEYSSSIDLNMKEFPAGVYILKMNIDSLIVNRKIVIL